jgi:hypothetical protein
MIILNKNQPDAHLKLKVNTNPQTHTKAAVTTRTRLEETTDPTPHGDQKLHVQQ